MMADVASHQPHTFSYYGRSQSDISTLFHNDVLSTDIEASEWLSVSPENPSPIVPRSLAPVNARQTPHTHQRANNSLSALPAFNFNPGQSSVAVLEASEPPQVSAASAPTTPARVGRHRRTASELIGGTGRLGSGIHLNSSPTRQWTEGFALPPPMPFGSLPSRLEYCHRRTDTTSSDNLNQNEQESKADCGKSLEPSTGVILNTRFNSRSTQDQDDKTTPSKSLALAKPRIHSSGSGSESPNAPKSPTRHRVGFSDTLEFIPRPLSTISSESGSSMSTIRLHSMSGSISSVLCSGTSSPLSKVVTSPTKLSFDGAELPARIQSASTLAEDVFPVDHTQSAISAGASPDFSGITGFEAFPQTAAQPVEHRRYTHAVETQNKRKTGSWTSLLSRKPKFEFPTTPSYECSNTLPVELSEDFDADPTSIIISDSHPLAFTPPITPPVTPNERKDFGDSPDTAALSSIIDLDAALGPDSTHDGRGPRGRSFFEARRSMHSNSVSSGFLNSNVHRRADSAPALTLVTFDASSFRERNNSISSFKRPQMEDVFEEDEDDTAPKDLQADSSNGSKTGLGMDMLDTAPTDAVEMSSLPTTPSDIMGTPTHFDFASRKLRFDAPWKGHREYRDDTGSFTGSEFVCDSHVSEVPRTSGTYSRITPDGNPPKHRRSLGSDTFPLPNRYHTTPSQRSGSPLPPSNCGCGNDCSVFNRRDTGTSSGNDHRKPYAQSVGERGSDVRYSVDDVPSLTSSGSTVVSNAHVRAPSSSRSFAPRSTSSSLSLSSGIERRRKRSSIVSFSRLVGAPFGDRPRTALEPGKRWLTPMEVEDVKQPKPSRLSRIFKFWKSKETPTSI